jgi:oligoendopeptidase F
MSRLLVLGAMMTGACLSVTDGKAQTRARSDVPPQDTWRLEDLYRSDQAWKQAESELAGRLDQILQYRGALTESASKMLACLTLNSDIRKELSRLQSYASMKSDEDTRSATYLAMKQQIDQLGTDYNTKASFIEPEIVALDREKVESFIAAEPGLAVYRLYLLDILRTKAHTLSKEEEAILARTG